MHRFAWVLIVAAALRMTILANTGGLAPQIVDEQHYLTLAAGLVERGELSFEPGMLTSIRPPLYPAFIAGVWKVTDVGRLQPVRFAQILLGLWTALLVYQLGLALFNPNVAMAAGTVTAFYPSLIISNFLLLTETLFTFLLVAMIFAAVRTIQRPSALGSALVGVLLGAAALTRSVLWPFPLLLAPLLFVALPGTRVSRMTFAALMIAGYVGVVGPWTLRNTRLQGVLTIVDTMGGMNLRMGNYEYTPEDRMWDAVSLTGDRSWTHGLREELPGFHTEGERERWARAKAFAYMRENPGITLRRAIIKFADFWGLEREYLAGLTMGLYRPSAPVKIFTVVTILLAYPLVVLAAAIGGFVTPPRDRRMHALLLSVILVICGVHTVVFGHSRYHLPLIPVLALYAGAALHGGAWQRLRHDYSTAIAPLAAAAVLIAFWVRQILVVDFPHVVELVRKLSS